MVNKPKIIGTKAEVATLGYAVDHGFPEATRKPPAGAKDVGDLWLTPGPKPKVMAEVKADKSLDYPQFLRETEKERVNASAAVGICVIKPPGVAERRMHLWWVLMHGGTYDALAQLAGTMNFMVSFMNADEAPLVSTPFGRRSRRFQPGNLLSERAELLRGMPGTTLKPGAKRISKAVGDMRFLYLPDAMELLRWAGFGEPMRPVPPEGRGFLTPGIQGFQADRVWYDEEVKWSN